MQDIYFNFEINDISIVNDDILICDPCSIQNGAFFFSKSVVDLNNAGKGIGFSEVALLTNQNQANKLASQCVDQLYSDGATLADVQITQLKDNGEYEYNLEVIYKQEISNE